MRHSFLDTHMIDLYKSFSKILYKIIGISIFVFSIYHISVSLYLSQTIENKINIVNESIARESKYLKEQGDEIGKIEEIKKMLISEDKINLIELMDREKENRSIGSLSIANKNGVILGRTLSKDRYGDNVF